MSSLLISSERKTDATQEGLPKRPGQHASRSAPGAYTGYAGKTMPAIREAIELKKWDDANAGIVVVSGVLQAEAALIDSAAAELGGAKAASH